MSIRSYEYWWNYLNRNKLMYFIGLLAVILCNLSQVFFARAMGHIIDFFNHSELPTWLIKSTRQETFSLLFFSILLSRVLLMFGRFGWRVTLARQTHKAAGEMKGHIWESARYFSVNDLVDHYPKGVLMNAANSDVGQARFIFGFTLVGLVDVIFLGVFTLICMLQINVTLSLTSLGVLLFTPFAIKGLSNKEVELYDAAQESLSSFNDLTSQAVGTVKLQKLGQTALFWNTKLLCSAEDYRAKRLRANMTSLLYIPYMGITSIISYIILFSLGLYLTTTNELSVGDFVAMQGLIFLLQDPLMELGFTISEWRKSGKSLARLEKIYKNPKEDFFSHSHQEDIKGENVYKLSDMSYSFENQPALFKGLNLEIQRGARIGITGRIGTGKTTLINILSGLDRRYKGEILFHDHDFGKYSHDELRRNIVCVHQKSFLFADSLRANVTI